MAAIAWKKATPALPDEARQPGPYLGRGPYPFCLPTAYAPYNLLPEAREAALDRFTRAGIPWHAGGRGRPCTHLLSSQVQCANALAPFVIDAEAVAAVFGDVLDIGEVLPFGDPASPKDVVAFEWTGMHDYLGERKGKPGTRGANTTSADAAIRYRTAAGAVEIALIEWKYTEHYFKPKLGGSASSAEVRSAAEGVGGHLHDLWHSMLATPDRFQVLDAAGLISPRRPRARSSSIATVTWVCEKLARQAPGQATRKGVRASLTVVNKCRDR